MQLENSWFLIQIFLLIFFRCRWTKNFTTMERWSRLTYTSKTTQTSPWKRSKCQSANLPIFASFRRPSTNVPCQNKKASKFIIFYSPEKLVKLQKKKNKESCSNLTKILKISRCQSANLPIFASFWRPSQYNCTVSEQESE